MIVLFLGMQGILDWSTPAAAFSGGGEGGGVTGVVVIFADSGGVYIPGFLAG